MPGARREVAQVAAEWVAKAEGDLKAAAQILKIKRECPTDTVVYHAQQCVEKYLKAVLSSEGIPFPKTHNIRLLVDLVPQAFSPSLDEDEQDMLTDYATGARYPGWGGDSFSGGTKGIGHGKESSKRAQKHSVERRFASPVSKRSRRGCPFDPLPFREREMSRNSRSSADFCGNY